MSPYEWVVADLAKASSRRLVRRTMRRLMAKTEELQSGADSPLTTVWDEICVQVQGEQSVFWAVYVETIRQFIAHEIGSLPPVELSAIWLQTRPGEDWVRSEEAEFFRAAPNPEDVVDHVLDEVISLASDWSNARIRKFQESTMNTDTDR